MRHQPNATANAAAITAAITYIICRIAVSLFPDLAMSIARSWFHGLELSKTGFDLSLGLFVLGLVSVTITTWLIAYIFANSYNYFCKKVVS